MRVWLEVGENDNGAGSGPGSYRDFRLANQRMAASLKAKGYHYHFDQAKGAGHVDGNVVAQTLPEAIAWAWWLSVEVASSYRRAANEQR